MSDFFDEAAGKEAPEEVRPTFETIPDGVNVIVRTTNSEDKETVQPKIKPFERKDGSGDFYIAKIPMKLIGGEKKIDAKFIGRYFFVDMNVEKPSLEQLEGWLANATTDGNKNRLKGQIKSHAKFPCGPELYNLILDTLAPEGANAAERFPKAMAVLGAKAKSLGYDADKFGGNTQLLMAETFRQVLLDGTYTVIARTYTPKQKSGSNYAPQQTVGSIGSDTKEERTKRKVEEIAPAVREDEAF